MSVRLNEDILLEIFKWFVSVDADGPFTIFFLSTTWRNILLRTPLLWTWVTIDSCLPDLAGRVHTCLEMTRYLPIYLTLKRPIPDLSPFDAVLKRAELLVAEVRDEVDICRIVFPLFKRHQFPNIQHVMYLRSTDGEEQFTDVDMLTIYQWGVDEDAFSTPENVLNAVKASPPEAITGFSLGSRHKLSKGTREDWGVIAVGVMKTFRYLRYLSLSRDAVIESFGQVQSTHILNLSNLRLLYYRDGGNILPRGIPTTITIRAPALDKLYTGDSFFSAVNVFHWLGLEAHPPEFTLSLAISKSAPDISLVHTHAEYYYRVTILCINLQNLGISLPVGKDSSALRRNPALILVKDYLHVLVAQMRRLWTVRIQVNGGSIGMLTFLLPFPRLKSKSPLLYNIEIFGDAESNIVHPIIGLNVDILKLDVTSRTSYTHLRPRHLVISTVSNIDDLIATICSFHPHLESLRIESGVQGTLKRSKWRNVPLFLSLTTLHATPQLTAMLLRLRIFPALKTLRLALGSNRRPRFDDEAFEILGDYWEVTLEMIEFPVFPSWPGLCRFINTRYSNTNSIVGGDIPTNQPLTLKFPARPCTLVLHFLAAAFKGEYLERQGHICEDHQNETGIGRGTKVNRRMLFSLTRERALEYYVGPNIDIISKK
ncbi:hypothetical protein FRC14_000212 [Serendipita sp. 396]|nr:hypothetical protein FRC14_000212 [Serendipita sp. 396]KAG8791968.1 hypothetical protein FRC16_000197 [Serendipita sp. 398]KAG8849389.1 hypothetical protein FRB91_010001 [Serendipita sp. 411]